MKICITLIVGIFKQFCCFDEVVLMALPSTEQLFIERPLYRGFLQNDHFRVTCVKKLFCNVVRFTIFHLSGATTGGVLLEKVLLEISRKSQEDTTGKVSFLVKLQAEVTAFDLSPIFS